MVNIGMWRAAGHELLFLRYRLQGFKVGAEILDRDEMIVVIL